MSDRVVIPLAGVGTLVLDADQFRQALERGRALSAQPEAVQQADERLLTADELEQRTGVPSSWWAEAARKGDVPFLRIGRYPRFRWSEVLACQAFRERG